MKVLQYVWKIAIITSIALLFACSKDRKLPESNLPTARILLGEELAAINIYNYYGRNEYLNTIDSLVNDTSFSLIPLSGGDYYENGLRLYFQAEFDAEYDAQFEWKVGDDPSIHVAKEFVLDFDKPIGRTKIRLITKYISKVTGKTGEDTTYHYFRITDESLLMGMYEGYNTDNPSEVFQVRIGWQYDDHPSIDRSYFAVSNLPNGFPIKSEIDPCSTSFGITGETIPSQHLFYQNRWVNAVYALGSLNPSRDSIVIKYNYGVIKEFPGNTQEWSTIENKIFKGKKL